MNDNYLYVNLVVSFIQDRNIATTGGPRQVLIIQNLTNIKNDPIFSVPGDIAINWRYLNNGHRLVLTGRHLSAIDSNDENTHGLGSHVCSERTNTTSRNRCRYEIANIQDCPLPSCPTRNVTVQGIDHGSSYTDGPVYDNYAIYVSKDAQRFPTSKVVLVLEMN